MSVKRKHSANPVDTQINQMKKLINRADVGVEMKSTTATNTTFIYNKTEQGIQQQHQQQQHLVMMTKWTVKQLNEIFHNNTDIE